MKKENLILLDYQDNFADNMSTYAYGQILAKNNNQTCYYENSTKKRHALEEKLSSFDVELNYISSSRVIDIAKYSFNLSAKNLKNRDNNPKFVSKKHFKIDDIDFIDDSIKNQFRFNNHNFVINHDILEEIDSTQSVGLYINENDIDKIDLDFIYCATKRLNKYVKKPLLFIFSKIDITDKIKSEFDFKIVNILNYKEEFYLHTKCKHKIIIENINSYSQNFWASYLNEIDYNYIIYNKKLKVKTKKHNWLGV